MTTPRASACALLVAALCGACESPTDATSPEPTLLALYIGDVHITRASNLALLPGTSLHFSVRLSDATGRSIAGLHPLLVSRTPRTLLIDSIGVVSVAGLGGSWIVGSLLTPARNVLADSTFVNVVCTVQSVPAIALTVVDSATGESTPLRSISVTVRDPLLRDSIFVASAAATPSLVFGLAYERRGTFDLALIAQGYRSWTRSAVVVAGDLCHVTTVAITARLQPL